MRPMCQFCCTTCVNGFFFSSKGSKSDTFAVNADRCFPVVTARATKQHAAIVNLMEITMKALTLRMLEQSGIDAEANPAIVALCEFAAQRSGIDWRDYYNNWSDRGGRKAYREEVASIGADLKRFREALNVAAVEGVTDADVIAEAPHAFSGRLTWATKQHTPASVAAGEAASEGDWSYCTGQYFCTEYRAAAATLLEYATRRVRQARPAESQERITTVDQLRALNERNGGCWFSRSTMRFHGTKIASGVIRGEFFITLDKRGFDEARGYGYNVRRFNAKGDVWSAALPGHDVTNPFNTKAEAIKALDAYLKTEAAQSDSRAA